MARNPIRDQVAIVGIGSTGFSRDAGGRSSKALACEASIRAIRDAGFEVDGNSLYEEVEASAPGKTRFRLAGGEGEILKPDIRRDA